MQKKNTNKIQILLIIVIAAIALATGGYIIYNQLNADTQASSKFISINNYKPSEIIEGETETILINGENFDDTCRFYLGNDRLNINFQNSESAELVLPSELDSDIVKVFCEDGLDSIEIKVKPNIQSLP